MFFIFFFLLWFFKTFCVWMFSPFFNSSLNFILALVKCLNTMDILVVFMKIVNWGFVHLAVSPEQLLVLRDAFARFLENCLVKSSECCCFCNETLRLVISLQAIFKTSSFFTIWLRSWSFLRVALRSICNDLMLLWWVLRVSLRKLLVGLFGISLHSWIISFSWQHR